MSKLEDKILETHFKIASDSYMKEAEAENDLLIEKYKDIEFPDNIDDWFEQELMSRSKINKRKSLYKKAIRMSKRIASFAVILLLLGATLTITVDAFRVKILNLITKDREEYTEFEFIDDGDNIVDIVNEHNLRYYPTYIPQGYQFDDFAKTETTYRFKFLKDDRPIFIVVQIGESSFRYDNDDMTVVNIDINGVTGKLIEKDFESTIMVEIEEYIIEISGENKEELILIVKSMF